MDAQAAATYIDGRCRGALGVQGAYGGQGKDKVTCLSCHTSVSYALGRPPLRDVTGDARPTTHESRQLEQVRSRVAHWGELDTPRYRLSYDHDVIKPSSSSPQPVVLNALFLLVIIIVSGFTLVGVFI